MAGITELAREYAEKNVSLATSMYNPQAETIAAYSFTDGYKIALEKAREIIGELQGILDKDICKDCDGGLHCSECYVNHAITTAGTFLEEYKK